MITLKEFQKKLAEQKIQYQSNHLDYIYLKLNDITFFITYYPSMRLDIDDKIVYEHYMSRAYLNVLYEESLLSDKMFLFKVIAPIRIYKYNFEVLNAASQNECKFFKNFIIKNISMIKSEANPSNHCLIYVDAEDFFDLWFEK